MDLSRPESIPPVLQAAAYDRDLVAKEILFHYRDPARFIFAVQIGRLRLVRYTSEGNLVIFEIVRPGETFALSALFCDLYPCNAIAEVPSRVIGYPKEQIKSILDDRPDLTMSFLERSHKKNKSLKVLLELRSIRSAKERLLQYLLVSTQPGMTTISFDRPLKDIANEIGLSAEVLYRTLAQLQKEGVITRSGREITLQTPAS